MTRQVCWLSIAISLLALTIAVRALVIAHVADAIVRDRLAAEPAAMPFGLDRLISLDDCWAVLESPDGTRRWIPREEFDRRWTTGDLPE